MTLLLLLRTPAYEEVLLEMARSAIARGNDGDYEVAVVTAQMAAEISSEQSIGTYLARKNVPELEEPLAGLFPSYSLANDRVLKLYTALRGDRLQDRPFWPAYKEHAARRNRVVHRGERADKAAAEASLAAVEHLLAYLRSAH